MRITLSDAKGRQMTLFFSEGVTTAAGAWETEISMLLQPGKHVAHGPVIGPYTGYDPSNPDHVVDAAHVLARKQGLELTVEGYDPGPGAGEYPGGDTRQEDHEWSILTPKERVQRWLATAKT